MELDVSSAHQVIQLGPSRKFFRRQRFPHQFVEAVAGIRFAHFVVGKHRRISIQSAFDQFGTEPELRPSFYFAYEFVVHKHAHADAGQIRAAIFHFFKNGGGHGLGAQQAQPGAA